MSTTLFRASLAAALIVGSVLAQAPDAERDRDRDGLSDFHEVHKYRTDPDKADSDGDGIPDGDWRERREYQYTVRTVVQVMRPVTIGFLCDDHQDARVLDETADHVELEVWHYPFNGVAGAIGADADWRRTAAKMKQWTAAGPTNDWTPAMRTALVAALRRDGIDPDRLDDRQLVEQASRWLCKHAACHDGFTTFVTAFDAKGKPYVPEALLAGAERNARERGWTIAQQWEREVSARGMFEHGVRGTCSSSAIYLNGCLRALGVPTRTVLCIPLVDAGDERELAMVEQGIRHHEVRRVVLQALGKLGGGWTSHTFNEVFVGGRWVRLNYERLGQPILDAGLFGLMTHVATFSDWADAGMPATIGRRQKGGRQNDLFGGNNPYSTIAVRDEFGVHCKLENPVAGAQRAQIRELRWCDAPGLPDDILAWFVKEKKFGLLAVVEGIDGDALGGFMAAADNRLQLRADGKPTLGVALDPGCWWVKDGRAFIAVLFGDADRRELAAKVDYRVAARNESERARWQLGPAAERLRRD